jgi:hypothetical protein
MYTAIVKPARVIAVERAYAPALLGRLLTTCAFFLVLGLALTLAGTAFVPGVFGAGLAVFGSFTALPSTIAFGFCLWAMYADRDEKPAR